MVAVLNDYTRKGSGMSSDPTMEISEVDKLVDGMDFGELCNDFECKSSPSVESTARQLARDILELRQGNRALGTFSVSVKYKVNSFCLITFSVSVKFRSFIFLCSASISPASLSPLQPHDGKGFSCLDLRRFVKFLMESFEMNYLGFLGFVKEC